MKNDLNDENGRILQKIQDFNVVLDKIVNDNKD